MDRVACSPWYILVSATEADTPESNQKSQTRQARRQTSSRSRSKSASAKTGMKRAKKPLPKRLKLLLAVKGKRPGLAPIVAYEPQETTRLTSAASKRAKKSKDAGKKTPKVGSLPGKKLHTEAHLRKRPKTSSTSPQQKPSEPKIAPAVPSSMMRIALANMPPWVLSAPGVQKYEYQGTAGDVPRMRRRRKDSVLGSSSTDLSRRALPY